MDEIDDKMAAELTNIIEGVVAECQGRITDGLVYIIEQDRMLREKIEEKQTCIIGEIDEQIDMVRTALTEAVSNDNQVDYDVVIELVKTLEVLDAAKKKVYNLSGNAYAWWYPYFRGYIESLQGEQSRVDAFK